MTGNNADGGQATHQNLLCWQAGKYGEKWQAISLAAGKPLIKVRLLATLRGLCLAKTSSFTKNLSKHISDSWQTILQKLPFRQASKFER